MLKALLKKELFSMLSFFLLNNRDGKRRSPLKAVGFIALMVYAFGAMGAMFWLIADTLCAPLVAAGLDWVYFALLGTIATSFGVVGGVFAAKSKLYEAKDNETLLSMPIPPWMILFTRTLGLYVLTFFFEALVFVPTIFCYFQTVGVAALSLVFCLLILFLLPLLAVAVCCFLGWGIAAITARLPSKNIFTLVLSALVFIAYFYVYSKINDYLNYVLAHGEAVGNVMKTALYPFWQMGLAAKGELLPMLVFGLIALGLFALVYLFLTKTYLRVVTTNRGERKIRYKEKNRRTMSVSNALLRKEWFRLFKTPAYLLNASLGSVLALVLCGYCLIKGDIFGLKSMIGVDVSAFSDALGLLATVLVCAVAAMNFITASSVSLEGDTLWLVKSLPVKPWQILRAKVLLHVLVTAIPVLITAVTISVTMELELFYLLLLPVFVFVFISLTATLGLAINLKCPNLRWTSETVAVKQSMASMLAMFASIGALALAVLPLFIQDGAALAFFTAKGYFLVWLGIYAAATAVVVWWLKNRGVKAWERL